MLDGVSVSLSLIAQVPSALAAVSPAEVQPIAFLQPLLNLWNGVWPYLLMLVGFSAIVFVHELGHFAVAKWVGVRVERFAIGFGRELFGFTKGETRYSFNLLPLGGYVKMLGQEDFDDKANELKFKEDPRSFVNKPVGHRMAIVSAGVIMNLIFAFLLFMVVFMIGKEEIGTRIGLVRPDTPAERAGLQPGDRIKQINGRDMLEFMDVTMAVMLAEPHEPIEFVVERQGELVGPIKIDPEYVYPESAQESRRLAVGFEPGFTPEIVAVGPNFDPLNPRHPRSGDVLVEVDGQEVTKDNANEFFNLLAYNRGPVIVERKDESNPSAPPKRVEVEIPPNLSLYPANSGDSDSVSVLGFAPLMRVAQVDAGGRAYYGGLREGDTVLVWDDRLYPSYADINDSVRANAQEDIFVKVQRADGDVKTLFIRPERNSRGPGTMQARLVNIPLEERRSSKSGRDDANESATGGAEAGAASQARVRVARVQSGGVAERAGLEPGDEIIACGDLRYPSYRDVELAVRQHRDKRLELTVRKPSGRQQEVTVEPVAPGLIKAGFMLADDLPRVGRPVPHLAGKPSPAVLAGVPAGATIESVAGTTIDSWVEFVDTLTAHAGDSVPLVYQDDSGASHKTELTIPNCLRTLLGVGPQAQILSVNGEENVTRTVGGRERQRPIGGHAQLGRALRDLVGQTVTVEYRANMLAPLQSKDVKISEGMVDPWLGRIAYQSNIRLPYERTLVKGDNALEAIMIGIHKTHYFVVQVYTMIDRIFSRSVALDQLSGPLGIVSIGGQIAQTDLTRFLFFLALISANLAVINFLPLPIVDGGLMVFLIIEKIKGSPVSVAVQVATQTIGLVLIIGAFIYVTFNDVLKMFG
jgi:membrane-associated protease RseP (regulator of RpoE activity)